MPQPAARDRFLQLLRSALEAGVLVKLTLGKHRGGDATLRNLLVRPVQLKSGPHLAFVYRHATRDVTKNHAATEALALLEPLIGGDFLDAHLFTTTEHAQFESQPDGASRLKLMAAAPVAAPAAAHDRSKSHLVPADAPWLRTLGVTNDRGQPREGMADKYRQIQKFAELLTHLAVEASLPGDRPIHIIDMGSGKGYLTFALAHVFGERARVRGIEQRAELVEFCQNTAARNGWQDRLAFTRGVISDAPIDQCDVLIALHACDTATDDALARGIAAGAHLLVVAPCCQKELRRQLTAPPVLAEALRHGIFQERQAEFVTDALRAQLLECAGYRTKVFEFISTEHTAKNLMIAATRLAPRGASPDPAKVRSMQQFAQFYGVRQQRLASLLGLPLANSDGT